VIYLRKRGFEPFLKARKAKESFMTTALALAASTISIREALALLDNEFASMAEGIAQRRYVFWLGSGISRDRVDDLKNVVARVLSYLRDHIDPADPACPYRHALGQAVALARLPLSDQTRIDISRPIAEWPAVDTLLANLSHEYARLLDIRVEGQPEDLLLWDAVDVQANFASVHAVPDCEHLCIAILILEGVLEDIASANWDGLIEAAVEELTEAPDTAVQVCIRAEDFREEPRPARLLKFHGCAVRAGIDPDVYRPFLIARRSQITAWPHNAAYATMRHRLVDLAATRCTLMIGLSAQDTNIQDVFAEAQSLMTWTWPCVPPAHVFAENALGEDQLNILRFVYREAYDRSGNEIEDGALFPAFAKPALSALVLHVLFAKLCAYARLAEAPHLADVDYDDIDHGLLLLRNCIAESAGTHRLNFILALVVTSSRGISLFRTGGKPPSESTVYRPLGSLPVHLLASDPALPTSGVREMAVALGILGLGGADGTWRLAQSDPESPSAGALRVCTTTGDVRIFFAANSRAAVQLEINSLISQDDRDAIVIHSTAPVFPMSRSPRAAPGRTGRSGLRNVSMAELLENANEASDLRRRFREEAAL
jgi:hypothetical protein